MRLFYHCLFLTAPSFGTSEGLCFVIAAFPRYLLLPFLSVRSGFKEVVFCLRLMSRNTSFILVVQCLVRAVLRGCSISWMSALLFCSGPSICHVSNKTELLLKGPNTRDINRNGGKAL